ncbi:MAG: hypothetical protein AB1797_10745 [bacterium]
MKKLPEFLNKYFWEVEFKNIDLQKRRVYVLRRILEYGDEQAVAWMWNNFKKSEIKNVLSNFRGYSQKSANYWALILDVPKKKVLCLKKPSSKEPRTFWPY